VFYGKDAFEGLRVLDRLGELRRGEEEDPTFAARFPSARSFDASAETPARRPKDSQS